MQGVGLKIGLVALLGSTSSIGLASTIAVIDSGVDYKHRDLTQNIWHNAGEIPDNSIDDDHDGYVDDVYGWNVAENKKEVIDYSYLGTFSDDCYKFFDVQGRMMQGKASEEDKAWLKQKREDKKFLAELSTFGNFVHGTHVAGIASGSRSTEKIVALKIIPTKVPSLPGMGEAAAKAELAKFSAEDQGRLADADGDSLLLQLAMRGLLTIAVNQQSKILETAGSYAAMEHVDVANGSFGANPKELEPTVQKILQVFLRKEPKPALVKKYAAMLADKMLEKSRGFVQKAKDTLFVFAAGNDGSNNDEITTSPANLGEPNSLSVAATLGRGKLAVFSNYGAKTVDVAAPGVAIKSTIPGDRYMELSGTSMAAPFVTEIAGLIKDANTKLSPADIKRIIMETVDVKDYLAGKVKTSGVVNSQRAVTAATLSTSLTLKEAISQAKLKVADAEDSAEVAEVLGGIDEKAIEPIAMPNPLFF